MYVWSPLLFTDNQHRHPLVLWLIFHCIGNSIFATYIARVHTCMHKCVGYMNATFLSHVYCFWCTPSLQNSWRTPYHWRLPLRCASRMPVMEATFSDKITIDRMMHKASLTRLLINVLVFWRLVSSVVRLSAHSVIFAQRSERVFFIGLFICTECGCGCLVSVCALLIWGPEVNL
jgi:hypothetical protein